MFLSSFYFKYTPTPASEPVISASVTDHSFKPLGEGYIFVENVFLLPTPTLIIGSCILPNTIYGTFKGKPLMCVYIDPPRWSSSLDSSGNPKSSVGSIYWAPYVSGGLMLYTILTKDTGGYYYAQIQYSFSSLVAGGSTDATMYSELRIYFSYLGDALPVDPSEFTVSPLFIEESVLPLLPDLPALGKKMEYVSNPSFILIPTPGPNHSYPYTKHYGSFEGSPLVSVHINSLLSEGWADWKDSNLTGSDLHWAEVRVVPYTIYLSVEGEFKYSFFKIIKYKTPGMFSFHLRPLRFSTSGNYY